MACRKCYKIEEKNYNLLNAIKLKLGKKKPRKTLTIIME